MKCNRIQDEELAGQKMELLYGEADAETRARLATHLDQCAACRHEMVSLRRLRGSLRAWTLEERRPSLTAARPLRVPIWLAAAGAILVPDATMRLAHLLGIGRGADLVFYIAILAALVVFFLLYLRLVRLEHHLTELVRHLALADAARRGPADD